MRKVAMTRLFMAVGLMLSGTALLFGGAGNADMLAIAAFLAAALAMPREAGARLTN